MAHELQAHWAKRGCKTTCGITSPPGDLSVRVLVEQTKCSATHGSLQTTSFEPDNSAAQACDSQSRCQVGGQLCNVVSPPIFRLDISSIFRALRAPNTAGLHLFFQQAFCRLLNGVEK